MPEVAPCTPSTTKSAKPRPTGPATARSAREGKVAWRSSTPAIASHPTNQGQKGAVRAAQRSEQKCQRHADRGRQGRRHRAAPAGRVALPFHEQVEHRGQRHADSGDGPRRYRVDGVSADPDADDSGRGRRGSEGELRRALHPRDEGGGGREEEEQEAERQEVVAQVRAEREVDREAERQQDSARPRPYPAALRTSARRIALASRLPASKAKKAANTPTIASPSSIRPGSMRSAIQRASVERGADQAEQHEARPAVSAPRVDEGCVQHEDVGEEPDRAIAAARCEEGRQEPADEPDRRDHLGAVAPGERAASGRRRGEPEEGDRARHEAVEGTSGPESRVQDHDTGSRERVRGAGVVAAKRPLRETHRGDAGHEPHHDAEPGRQEPALDRVSEEEEAGEREHRPPRTAAPRTPSQLSQSMLGPCGVGGDGGEPPPMSADAGPEASSGHCQTTASVTVSGGTVASSEAAPTSCRVGSVQRSSATARSGWDRRLLGSDRHRRTAALQGGDVSLQSCNPLEQVPLRLPGLASAKEEPERETGDDQDGGGQWTPPLER